MCVCLSRQCCAPTSHIYVCGDSPQLFSALLSAMNGQPRVFTRGDKTNPTKETVGNRDAGGNIPFFKKEKRLTVTNYNHSPQRVKER